MHHCNRNLVRLSLDATTEVDAFAAGQPVVFAVHCMVRLRRASHNSLVAASSVGNWPRLSEILCAGL